MKNYVHKKQALFSVLVALALLVASLPQSNVAAQTTQTNCRTFYVVQEGDTTPKIAQTYGFKWRVIARANDMNPADKLVVGERLCIPPADTTDDDDRQSANPRATITATISGGRIVLATSNFSTRSAFKVKVRPATTGVGGWHVVGNLNIGRNESLTTVYTLPQELRGVPNISVCLKNLTTDELHCVNGVNL